jgi:hypothetical protein
MQRFIPSDFVLSGCIASRLIDRQYQTDDEGSAHMKDLTQSISRDLRIKVLDAWIQRFQRCIERTEDHLP